MFVDARVLAFSLLLLSSPASAQFAAVVGPPIAPLGAPITIALSNDTVAPVVFLPSCAYSVWDSSGGLVYQLPNCSMVFSTLQPGASFVAEWPQVDQGGQQVTAGTYRVQVLMPPFPGGGVADTFVVIGGVEAAVALRGVPRIGTARGLALDAPRDGGRSFVLMASLATSPGIPTCAGLLPLRIDDLLVLSLTNGSTVMRGFQGALNAAGRATSPILAPPRMSTLIGATIYLGFAALDPAAPCPVARLSAPLAVTLR